MSDFDFVFVRATLSPTPSPYISHHQTPRNVTFTRFYRSVNNEFIPEQTHQLQKNIV